MPVFSGLMLSASCARHVGRGWLPHRSCTTCSVRPAISSRACCTHGRSPPGSPPKPLHAGIVGVPSSTAAAASHAGSADDRCCGSTPPRHELLPLSSHSAAQSAANSSRCAGGAVAVKAPLRSRSALASPPPRKRMLPMCHKLPPTRRMQACASASILQVALKTAPGPTRHDRVNYVSWQLRQEPIVFATLLRPYLTSDKLKSCVCELYVASI